MHRDLNGLLSAPVKDAVTNQQRSGGRNQFTARKTTMAVVLGNQCSLGGVFFYYYFFYCPNVSVSQ